jgi:thioredoxin-like negative regulator of GroEL
MRHGGPAGVAVVCGVIGAMLAGCGTNRPMPLIKRDAEHYYATKQWDKAQKDYAEFLGRKPDDNEVRFMLAKSLLNDGKAKEALPHLVTALDVEPLRDDIVDTLALAYFEADEREALTAFVNRIASERGRPIDYIRSARYAQALGHPDEAQTALLTATRIDAGRSFDVQLALADFYKTVGDRGKMVQRLRYAYFLNPENPQLQRSIREAGEVPGPTFGLVPEELRVPQTANVGER